MTKKERNAGSAAIAAAVAAAVCVFNQIHEWTNGRTVTGGGGGGGEPVVACQCAVQALEGPPSLPPLWYKECPHSCRGGPSSAWTHSHFKWQVDSFLSQLFTRASDHTFTLFAYKFLFLVPCGFVYLIPFFSIKDI